MSLTAEPCVTLALRATFRELAQSYCPLPSSTDGTVSLRAVLLQSRGTSEEAGWAPYNAVRPDKLDDGSDDTRLLVLVLDGGDRLIGQWVGQRGSPVGTHRWGAEVPDWWRTCEVLPSLLGPDDFRVGPTREGAGPFVWACSWCRPNQRLPSWLRVTHGVCPECAKRLDEDLPPFDVLTGGAR